MKLHVPLRRTAERADFPSRLTRVHITALAANPQHRTLRVEERAVLKRLVQVLENNSVIILYHRNLFEFERDLLKPLFPCGLCEAGIDDVVFFPLVLRREF